MTLRQLHATMANPWWHLCEECRRLHVADADKSNGVVIFGKCGKCKSGLDRKEPLPGLLSDCLPVMPEKRPAVQTDDLLITNQRTRLDLARLQGADSETASLLTL